MKNLLIPTDFSKYSDHALEFAIEFAQNKGGKLYLLHSVYTTHIFDSLYLDPILAARLMKDVETAAEEKLASMRSEISKRGVDVETVSTCSPLIDAIEDVIKGNHIDLVLMGTKGASGLKEFFIGSNTEKVMRISSVPVLAIPDDFRFDQVKHIIVPIDYLQVTERFMQEVLLVQQIFGATLDFVWVKTHHFMDQDDLLHANFEHYARKKFGNIYNVYIKRDMMPESAILRFIDEIDADLVMMPTSQKKGIEHLFLGSTTENLANHSPVPVLGFPTKKTDKPLQLRNEQQEEFGEFIL